MAQHQAAHNSSAQAGECQKDGVVQFVLVTHFFLLIFKLFLKQYHLIEMFIIYAYGTRDPCRV